MVSKAKPKTKAKAKKTKKDHLEDLRKSKEALAKAHEHKATQNKRERLLKIRSVLEGQGLLPVKKGSDHMLPLFMRGADFAI